MTKRNHEELKVLLYFAYTKKIPWISLYLEYYSNSITSRDFLRVNHQHFKNAYCPLPPADRITAQNQPSWQHKHARFNKMFYGVCNIGYMEQWTKAAPCGTNFRIDIVTPTYNTPMIIYHTRHRTMITNINTHQIWSKKSNKNLPQDYTAHACAIWKIIGL